MHPPMRRLRIRCDEFFVNSANKDSNLFHPEMTSRSVAAANTPRGFKCAFGCWYHLARVNGEAPAQNPSRSR